MAETIDMGIISSRGQIAIPIEIREKMHLKEGGKVIFFLEGDSLLIKKVENLSWKDITKPLREAKKKIREEDVPELVHKLRKRWMKVVIDTNVVVSGTFWTGNSYEVIKTVVEGKQLSLFQFQF